MSYTITYKEDSQRFEMDGKLFDFIGNHLEVIGKKEKIAAVDEALSEGHMLAILVAHGIKVDLLEENGSRMEW